MVCWVQLIFCGAARFTYSTFFFFFFSCTQGFQERDGVESSKAIISISVLSPREERDWRPRVALPWVLLAMRQ